MKDGDLITQIWSDLDTGEEVIYRSVDGRPAFLLHHVMQDSAGEDVAGFMISLINGSFTTRVQEVRLPHELFDGKMFESIAPSLRHVTSVILPNYYGKVSPIKYLLRNNSQHIKKLDLSFTPGLQGHRVVGDLIAEIGDLSNLESINVRNDCRLGLNLTNIESISLARKLRGLEHLTHVAITLPYSPSLVADFCLNAAFGHESKSDAVVIMIFSPLIESIGIAGARCRSEARVLWSLAEIPALTSLTLGNLNLITDNEKLRSIFQCARPKDAVPVAIDIQ
jgi:hypothetical protein